MSPLSGAAASFGVDEQAAVAGVIKSGRLTQGLKVEEFEQEMGSFLGARHAVAVSSGSAALTTALMAHGVGPGQEVVVPSFTFFATAASVMWAGATPVFADIDPHTFCLDPGSASAAVTANTSAILPVHLFGHPADVPALRRICKTKGLLLIEDAAQAHGAAVGETKVGATGTACFSFYPTKNMTTGEGGMVLTDDPAVAEAARSIRNQGLDGASQHSRLGFNFRMTEVAAAIGLVQLRRLPEFNLARAENARFYSSKIESAKLPVTAPGSTHVFNQYTVRVAPARRDRALDCLRAGGVDARVYYRTPIHRQPALRAAAGSGRPLPETDKAAAEAMSLPVHPLMTPSDLAGVVSQFEACC